jgi:hypothetical protein
MLESTEGESAAFISSASVALSAHALKITAANSIAEKIIERAFITTILFYDID